MSKKEINFLSADRSQVQKEQEKFIKSLRKVGIVLAAALLLIAASFGYSIYLTNQSRRLVAKEKNLGARLNQLEGKISLLLILKERLGKAKQVLQKEPVMADNFLQFWQSVPEGIIFRDIRVGKDNISVSGAGNMLSISRLAEEYTNQKHDWYTSASLESLAKTEEEEDLFEFSLSIKF